MNERASSANLLRIATALLAFLVAYLVYAASEPGVAGAQQRLDDDEQRLRSDDSLFAQSDALLASRRQLLNRYRSAIGGNPEAGFVRFLAADAARHGVTIVSTSFVRQTVHARPGDRFGSFVTTASAANGNGDDQRFATTKGLVELRGHYTPLLETIAELSRGDQIARVEPPNFRRDTDAVVASVPITVLKPLAATTAQRETR